MSMANMIRNEFEKGKSRKQISLELGVKYNTVYKATANMHNDSHPDIGKSVASSPIVPRINLDGNFLNENGDIVEDKKDAFLMTRNNLVVELFSTGKIRRTDLAKFLNISYATVYSNTRHIENETIRGVEKHIKLSDGNKITRNEYIQELFKQGHSRKQIAVLITQQTGEYIDYATIWHLTK